MPLTVRQLLDRKSSGIYSIRPDASVLEALELMAREDISSVMVIEGEEIKGIFTERDYARKVVLKGLLSRDVRVGDLMTPNPCTVTPSHTVDEVMHTMTENRFRHLPVVYQGKIMGIVTIGDMVKSVVSQQEATIKQLESYIAGDLAAE